MTRRSDCWTKEPPDQDGWYWHRESIAHKAVIRYVRGGSVYLGLHRIGPVQTFGGEWYGPLQEPGGDAIENCTEEPAAMSEQVAVLKEQFAVAVRRASALRDVLTEYADHAEDSGWSNLAAEIRRRIEQA